MIDQNNCSASTNNFTIEEPQVISLTTTIIPSFPGFDYKGEYNGKYLYFHTGAMTWQVARAECQNNGGDLISILSSADQIEYNARFGSGFGWIGLFQNSSSLSYSEPFGGWEWVDGTPLNFNFATNSWIGYENWGGGEPNDFPDGSSNFKSPGVQCPCPGLSGTESYGEFVGSPGNFVWNDIFNWATKSFYMEIPNNNVIDGNNVTCFGGNDGDVVATAVGGQAPYTFTWSGPLGISFQTGTSTINPGTDTAYQFNCW